MLLSNFQIEAPFERYDYLLSDGTNGEPIGLAVGQSERKNP